MRQYTESAPMAQYSNVSSFHGIDMSKVQDLGQVWFHSPLQSQSFLNSSHNHSPSCVACLSDRSRLSVCTDRPLAWRGRWHRCWAGERRADISLDVGEQELSSWSYVSGKRPNREIEVNGNLYMSIAQPDEYIALGTCEINEGFATLPRKPCSTCYLHSFRLVLFNMCIGIASLCTLPRHLLHLKR